MSRRRPAGEGRPEAGLPGRTGRARAWAELLRLPALFTVPGDALAGAAATSGRANRRTLLAIGSSLCLYEAGMALNDWADRVEDAVERPHRPLPSGRVHPTAALAAACAFTGAGLSLAACAGRPALTVAVPLAATVWAYDLSLKHTAAGPAAMAAARGLDLLLGAAATATSGIRPALPSAAVLGAHTFAVTTVSRRETQGGSPLAALSALTTTAALSGLLTHPPRSQGSQEGQGSQGSLGTPGTPGTPGRSTSPAVAAVLTAAYASTVARPYFHATLNPSPPLTQRAVGAGIRAMIPLQCALSARSGAPVAALLTAALSPLAARFAKKVSVT
ncbi:UbiA family prenyltransferase [Streptomyces lincolnensis]|uniref:SCO3242 family prenyltransferase n=1 Tax=Streptomyces lincolnensis TaxID=1915 RepID=UPI001E5B0389|nr:UbiA family prenyltransferase [Streptomyces lincolnensis]MCD7436785.1 UbiA family prenyltransferase [Streptomyces lincolnensis]